MNLRAIGFGIKNLIHINSGTQYNQRVIIDHPVLILVRYCSVNSNVCNSPNFNRISSFFNLSKEVEYRYSKSSWMVIG